jgi:lipoprotein NlpD
MHGRRLSCPLIIGFLLAATGCFDASHPAPVVNAWHQSHASSSDYVAREGDTIYSVAWSFGLDYRALAAANHLSPPYILTAGQRLVMTTAPAGTSKQLKTRSLHDVSPANHFASQTASQPHYHLSSHHWQRPAQGVVIQGFSTNPSGQPGISIAGRLGSPIHAAADGVVVYSGDGVRGYGNLIIVKHNNSYLSAYGFNERNLVSVGDRVHAGRIIARMGKNDGGRTLLYFEIRRDGVPVNPVGFLR